MERIEAGPSCGIRCFVYLHSTTPDFVDGSGRPRIPEGDPDPVPYKPLWGEVEVNPAKRNAEKEMFRASESTEKKGFIINGISKYIQYWRLGMARNARYAAEMSCFVKY
jgi:hypothetical protein